MRLTTVTLLVAVGAGCCFSSTASAGVKVVVVTRTYDVTGASGEALVTSMDRNGPRHGFMARAIAQTNYTKTWDFDFTKAKGGCRIKQANGTLNLNFVYPRIASPSRRRSKSTGSCFSMASPRMRRRMAASPGK